MQIKKSLGAPHESCTFSCGKGGHRADLIELDDAYTVWIYHKNHSMKCCMAEVRKDENPEISFEEMIEVVRWHLEYYVDRYDNWVLEALNKMDKPIKTKKEEKA